MSGGELEPVGRLALAALVGFVIGLERESAGQPAGERTHALVALGSATFALLSLQAFPDADRSRIAAGVVSGLGFLGAGRYLYGLVCAAITALVLLSERFLRLGERFGRHSDRRATIAREGPNPKIRADARAPTLCIPRLRRRSTAGGHWPGTIRRRPHPRCRGAASPAPPPPSRSSVASRPSPPVVPPGLD